VRDRVSLWAESFDAPFTDVFSIEDSIASQVSRALALKLTPEARGRLAKRYTDNAEAYELYLRGRVHLWDRNTRQGVEQAIQYFERALAKDPNYALAWAGLADCYSFGLFMGWRRPLSEVIPRAKAAARRALEIDEQLAEAHTAMAVLLYRYDWDFPAAEKEFRRSLELILT
jgi:Tfp pilus assembly protein PilF